MQRMQVVGLLVGCLQHHNLQTLFRQIMFFFTQEMLFIINTRTGVHTQMCTDFLSMSSHVVPPTRRGRLMLSAQRELCEWVGDDANAAKAMWA